MLDDIDTSSDESETITNSGKVTKVADSFEIANWIPHYKNRR